MKGFNTIEDLSEILIMCPSFAYTDQTTLLTFLQLFYHPTLPFLKVSIDQKKTEDFESSLKQK